MSPLPLSSMPLAHSGHIGLVGIVLQMSVSVSSVGDEQPGSFG